ncbi:MAG: extracellular solute-binding protein [Chloroflexi bacterium]|nr:extracellular solute-binding protein [Chloroflexota bacterium]
MMPEITIKMESFPGANYFQKISVLVAGGTEGDLVFMPSIQGLYGYASRGVWRWTDNYIARDKIDMSQWYPAALQMMKFQGKTIGLPLWAHPSVVGLFYNEDLFKAQGMTPPNGSETFTQLSDMATRLTKTSSSGVVEQYGYLPGTDWYNGLGQVILAMGGQMLSSDGKKLTFDQPEPTAALQWLDDLFQKSKVAPNPTMPNVGLLSVNGKLAMWASGVWGSWSASTWKFNWGVTLTPVGAQGSHGAMLQTDTNPITARSKVSDAAWQFHKFMATEQAGEILLEKSYVWSPRPDISAKAAKVKGLAPFAQVMPQAVALPVPANYHCNRLDLTIDPITTDLWLGKLSVDQAVQKLDQAGDVEIAQP